MKATQQRQLPKPAEKPQPPQRVISSAVGDDPTDPHVDYRRTLTEAGGILLTYKDWDFRFRYTLWRWFAWITATGLEARYVLAHSPLHMPAMTWLCLVLVAVINYLIVEPPVEVYRTVEFRPDCMILDGVDVFWRNKMEIAPPAFEQDEIGNLVLSGTYGTRFVEYLTIIRFDDFDRAPEVFASHVQHAMQQLWTRPL